MKAIVLTEYGSTDVLELREITKPSPKDDEVLIKIHATAVNDWDWCLMRGKPYAYRPFFGLLKPKVSVLGAEVAGAVEAAGQNVTEFQSGDEVYGDISESDRLPIPARHYAVASVRRARNTSDECDSWRHEA